MTKPDFLPGALFRGAESEKPALTNFVCQQLRQYYCKAKREWDNVILAPELQMLLPYENRPNSWYLLFKRASKEGFAPFFEQLMQTFNAHALDTFKKRVEANNHKPELDTVVVFDKLDNEFSQVAHCFAKLALDNLDADKRIAFCRLTSEESITPVLKLYLDENPQALSCLSQVLFCVSAMHFTSEALLRNLHESMLPDLRDEIAAINERVENYGGFVKSQRMRMG